MQAARRAVAAKGPGFEAEDLEAALWTAGLPELDLLVRTSGERRISNFLLWQCAYAELHFSEVLWPDFRERELLARHPGLPGPRAPLRDDRGAASRART